MDSNNSVYDRALAHGKELNKIFKSGLGSLILLIKLRKLEDTAKDLNLQYFTNRIDSMTFYCQRAEIVNETKRLLRYDLCSYVKSGKIALYYCIGAEYALKILVHDRRITSCTNLSTQVHGAYIILAPEYIEEVLTYTKQCDEIETAGALTCLKMS